MMIDLADGRTVNPDHVVWSDDVHGVVYLTLVSLDPATGDNERLTLRDAAAAAWRAAVRGLDRMPPPSPPERVALPLLDPPAAQTPERVLSDTWIAGVVG